MTRQMQISGGRFNAVCDHVLSHGHRPQDARCRKVGRASPLAIGSRAGTHDPHRRESTRPRTGTIVQNKANLDGTEWMLTAVQENG